ncbi:PRTRC system protein C [Pedobacter sp. GR22-10]|uniref:PRTRC system protein C n=1 Tax=Pedobacter sp. GR22-10 TaxID=2994472 RepID=UPI0022482E16|nr:PRTRC system protein C [Pedobacter sp. GR22-10]MCX2429869.1 PRTRC system protein C [Pedobacter sp. GR22-10]
MLIAKALPRIFLYKVKNEEVKLPDPELSLSPQAVMNFYTRTYPELVTAKLEGPVIREDEVQYKFTSTVGTKG